MKKLVLLSSFLFIFLFGFILAAPKNSLAQGCDNCLGEHKCIPDCQNCSWYNNDCTCDNCLGEHKCIPGCQNCKWYDNDCTGECVCMPNDPNPCSSVCLNCYWYKQKCRGGLEKEVHNPLLSPALSVLSGSDFLQKFLTTGVRFGFFVGIVIFFFLLLIGAIKWIVSGSDKTQLEGAQKQITHALIGLVILLSIFAIISVIESILGISITTIILPTL